MSPFVQLGIREGEGLERCLTKEKQAEFKLQELKRGKKEQLPQVVLTLWHAQAHTQTLARTYAPPFPLQYRAQRKGFPHPAACSREAIGAKEKGQQPGTLQSPRVIATGT